MLGKEYSYQQVISELQERAKELKCLYRVEELINKDPAEDDFFYELLKTIPNGWQYPAMCRIKITYKQKEFMEPGWTETSWKQSADLEVDEKVDGKIEVFYTQFKKLHIDSQFLPEEQKLLNTIAKRVSFYLFSKKLANSFRLLQKKNERNEKLVSNALTIDHDIHWKWRCQITHTIAEKMDLQKFGIKSIYLIGSTKECNAGPASDIDLLIHMEKKGKNLPELKAWINGWGLCLSEINYSRTGYKTDGLIDLHIVTDEDIRNKSSFASMIGALSNSAKLIRTVE